MDKLFLKAYGKLNLGLDVLGIREDGYHEVKMVMQSVNLYDGIEIEKTDKKDIEIETNLYYLPLNENNIVYKATKLLFDEFGINEGVKIKLDKRIPVAAGMAGGSADAAAVLRGINKMFNLGLKRNDLMESRQGAFRQRCLYAEYDFGQYRYHLFSPRNLSVWTELPHELCGTACDH